jgi:hypothetical protein
MTMLTNNGGAVVTAVSRGLEARMAYYDTLPSEYRKLLQEAPYNIQIRPDVGLPRLALLREQINNAKRESILKTYGPDHPNLEKCCVR